MALIVLVVETMISRLDGLGFSPTQYGSTVSPSYNHHFPIGTIADINGVNSGFGGNDDIPTGWAFNN